MNDEKKEEKKEDNKLKPSDNPKKTGLSALGFINLFYKLNLFNRVSVFKSDLTE